MRKRVVLEGPIRSYDVKTGSFWIGENKLHDNFIDPGYSQVVSIEDIEPEPNLGFATTRELIDELTARSDLDYRTVDHD